ncbi:glycerol dehydratase reactivase beta/small subunit family protein [Mycolicibacterium wolinskyi]|uniref:PduH protein n=1 Tax=Mycolicibacterium wolinskyi TaxID=59750 RepID=A0A1X2F0Y1_9MYCO|nr:glycerol dehydratase reactivase beta/small subunit family protein [Mycolicibacterium wolinskyi]MCV7295676.1 glycerol dehydratase reactivase beta/small subunit family protein [Mycolicibacterium goodii]ORX12101.1 pduH protein [Mycolicibacterium wolinskyi]
MVVLSAAGGGVIEREVLAGIEEEGVPHSLLPAGLDAVAADLARHASARSPLRVGVGLDATGEVCVHHEQLAEPLPDLGSGGTADAETARTLGHNAARIVVGLPLKRQNRFGK